MKVATPVKGTSWPSLISDIELVGESNGRPFPVEKEKQIRTVISATIKHRFPDRTYKASKKNKDDKMVLWVWRAA